MALGVLDTSSQGQQDLSKGFDAQGVSREEDSRRSWACILLSHKIRKTRAWSVGGRGEEFPKSVHLSDLCSAWHAGIQCL